MRKQCWGHLKIPKKLNSFKCYNDDLLVSGYWIRKKLIRAEQQNSSETTHFRQIHAKFPH